jgi:hypothetical protein
VTLKQAIGVPLNPAFPPGEIIIITGHDVNLELVLVGVRKGVHLKQHTPI